MFEIHRHVRRRSDRRMHWVFVSPMWKPREVRELLASLPVSYEILRDSRYSSKFRFRVTPNLGHEIQMEIVCTKLFDLVPNEEADYLLAGRDGRLPLVRPKQYKK